MHRCIAGIVVTGSVVATLTGCSASRSAQLTLSPAAGAGGSWAAVLPADATDPGTTADGWILTRNDEALNPRPVEAVLASNDWPEPVRPSLERPILIRVYQHPGRYYSYGPERRYYDNTRTRRRR